MNLLELALVVIGSPHRHDLGWHAYMGLHGNTGIETMGLARKWTYAKMRDTAS